MGDHMGWVGPQGNCYQYQGNGSYGCPHYNDWNNSWDWDHGHGHEDGRRGPWGS
jgi:hypothetical protein